MVEVEVYPWDEHAAVGEAGVGTVYLLHNNNNTPHVDIYEMNMEVVSTCCPPPAAIDCA